MHGPFVFKQVLLVKITLYTTRNRWHGLSVCKIIYDYYIQLKLKNIGTSLKKTLTFFANTLWIQPSEQRCNRCLSNWHFRNCSISRGMRLRTMTWPLSALWRRVERLSWISFPKEASLSASFKPLGFRIQFANVYRPEPFWICTPMKIRKFLRRRDAKSFSKLVCPLLQKKVSTMILDALSLIQIKTAGSIQSFKSVPNWEACYGDTRKFRAWEILERLTNHYQMPR